jgi:hypothetical protein
MHCFTCLKPSAGSADPIKRAVFCDVSCQEAFYIGGEFKVLLNSSKWNKDVFKKMLKEIKAQALYRDHLSFIDALLVDANEEQRETLFRWILDDESIRAIIWAPNATKDRLLKYLLQVTIENDLKNLLYYLPIGREASKGALKQASRKYANDVEIIRILHLKFKYSINEFIDYCLSYLNPTSMPAYAIQILKLFGTLLNDKGKRMTQQFIDLLRVGERKMYAPQADFTANIMKAFASFIVNVNVSIEPGISTKKPKTN